MTHCLSWCLIVRSVLWPELELIPADESVSVMLWQGYSGQDAYRPPLACSEGSILRITNVSRVYCCRFGSNCQCRGRCTDECSSSTVVQVNPTYCGPILRCDRTTGCRTLAPPKTRELCYTRQKYRVFGVCVTGKITLPLTFNKKN